ncbi:hypothetical protein BLNAU_12888 [Blattamonas nauphoetae]|uniref:Cyclin N-terminal domain-containing protein n=1 Tax=Blattamonas nauphoetae TaxID=2049346 RepID=A0ABQ9XLX2_9EUKA|nr:hypothetical protein BLNAU_12888 [Blattamonas nauphoetae]
MNTKSAPNVKKHQKPDIKLVPSHVKSELLKCSTDNDTISLRRLLETGIDLHVVFYYACAYSVLPVVSYFVSDPFFDINIGVNLRRCSISPLYIACCYGSTDVVRCLLRRSDLFVNVGKSEIRVFTNQKYTESPLHAALMRNRIDVVNVLLTQLPDPLFDRTSFHPAFCRSAGIFSLEDFPKDLDHIVESSLDLDQPTKSSSPSPSSPDLHPMLNTPRSSQVRLFPRLLTSPGTTSASEFLSPSNFHSSSPPNSDSPEVSVVDATIPLTRLVDATCGVRLSLINPTPQDPVLFPISTISFPVDLLDDDNNRKKTKTKTKTGNESDLFLRDAHHNFIGKRPNPTKPAKTELRQALKKTGFNSEKRFRSHKFSGANEDQQLDDDFSLIAPTVLTRKSCLVNDTINPPLWIFTTPRHLITEDDPNSSDLLQPEHGVNQISKLLVKEDDTTIQLFSLYHSSITKIDLSQVRDLLLTNAEGTQFNPDSYLDDKLDNFRLTDDVCLQRDQLNLSSLPSSAFASLFKVGDDVIISPHMSLSSASFKREHMVTTPRDIILAEGPVAAERNLVVICHPQTDIAFPNDVLEKFQNFDGALLPLNRGDLAGIKTDPLFLRQLNSGLTADRQIATFPVLSLFRRVTILEHETVGKDCFETFFPKPTPAPPQEPPVQRRIYVNPLRRRFNMMAERFPDFNLWGIFADDVFGPVGNNNPLDRIFARDDSSENEDSSSTVSSESSSLSSISSFSLSDSSLSLSNHIDFSMPIPMTFRASKTVDSPRKPQLSITDSAEQTSGRRIVGLFDINEDFSILRPNTKLTEPSRRQQNKYIEAIKDIPHAQEVSSHSFFHNGAPPLLVIPPIYTATARNNPEAIRLLRMFDSNELQAMSYNQYKSSPTSPAPPLLTTSFPHVQPIILSDDSSDVDSIQLSISSDSSMSEHTAKKIKKKIKKIRTQERLRTDKREALREYQQNGPKILPPKHFRTKVRRHRFFVDRSIDMEMTHSLVAGWRIRSQGKGMSRNMSSSHSTEHQSLQIEYSTLIKSILNCGLRIQVNMSILGSTPIALAAERKFDNCVLELLKFENINPNKFSVDSTDTQRASQLRNDRRKTRCNFSSIERSERQDLLSFTEENDHRLQLLLREALIGTHFVYQQSICPPLASSVLGRSTSVVSALLNDPRVIPWMPFYIEWDAKHKDYRFLTAELLATSFGFSDICDLFDQHKSKVYPSPTISTIKNVSDSESMDSDQVNVLDFENVQVQPVVINMFNLSEFGRSLSSAFTPQTLHISFSFVHSLIKTFINTAWTNQTGTSEISRTLLAHPLVYSPLKLTQKSLLQHVLDDLDLFTQILHSANLPLVVFALAVLSVNRFFIRSVEGISKIGQVDLDAVLRQDQSLFLPLEIEPPHLVIDSESESAQTQNRSLFDLSKTGLTAFQISRIVPELICAHAKKHAKYLMRVLQLLHNTKWSSTQDETSIDWRYQDSTGKTCAFYSASLCSQEPLAFLLSLSQPQFTSENEQTSIPMHLQVDLSPDILSQQDTLNDPAAQHPRILNPFSLLVHGEPSEQDVVPEALFRLYSLPPQGRSPSFSQPDRSGMTPLMIALHKQDQEVIDLLLNSDCVPLKGEFNSQGVYHSPIKTLIGLGQGNQLRHLLKIAKRRERKIHEQTGTESPCLLGFENGLDLLHCVKLSGTNDIWAIEILHHIQWHVNRFITQTTQNRDRSRRIEIERRFVDLNVGDKNGTIAIHAANSNRVSLVSELGEFKKAVAHYLEGLCCVEHERKQFNKVEFHTEPNSVTLFRWVYHIYKMSKISPSGIILTCILLEQIHSAFPSLHFSNLNIRRLFLIGAMVIAKVYEDVTYCNKDWVVIGDHSFTLRQINQMERELLTVLKFYISISVEEYDRFTLLLLRDYSVHMPISMFPPSSIPSPPDGQPTRDTPGYLEFYIPNQTRT